MNVCLKLARVLLEREGCKGQTYMFTLRSVAALNIAKGRVGLYDTGRDEVIETEQVLIVAEAIEIAPAEGQGAEVLGDGVEQRLCG